MKEKKHTHIGAIIFSLFVLLTSESLANNTSQQQEQKATAPTLVNELDQKREVLMDKIDPIKRERAQ